MFRIDKTNIDYIFGKTNAKGHRSPIKVKVLKCLHFSKGKADRRTRINLTKVWW